MIDDERLIPIAGSHNLRDLGGYRTADGRTVRRGLLYRSGVMTGTSEADHAAFRDLGIATIFDLRANHERTHRPTVWHEGTGVTYHSRDHEQSVGALDRMIETGSVAAEGVTTMIREVYRQLPFEQAGSYRALFRLILDRQLPLLFNCTAGKDRTGVAAALILCALGVPREAIEYDYTLTELSLDRLVAIILEDPRYAGFTALPREDYLPMLRADAGYLSIAFETIEDRHGSVVAYLDEVLGVGPADIEALRAALLE